MNNFRAKLIFTLIIISSFNYLPGLVFSLRLNPHNSNSCDNKVDPRTLQSDQMAVVINGYSERRIPLLQSIAARYSASASVSTILIIWCNPSTPSQTLSQLSYNLSIYSTINAPISLIHERSQSLNSRFYPRELIDTRAVLICDDDVELDSKSINFAFNIWKSNPDRLIGFFARSHAYGCGSGTVIEELRKIVDADKNCEDILMNFLVADKVNAGPVLVGAERVRDWGDARNEGEVGKEEREVGLSSRRGDHRKRRGECIREFHRILGRMPLRYSYGKVVNSVGEQGLCEKGGKLVFCDQQLLK
ncbi:hypothetical protein ACH5RR_040081 [Cinchona calisaya]|uniref:Glycosyl transferase 64 domain-containing protein n=1 Tax=Cinchona calisaya TaxID=153742 RepID=A0ABD2XTA9_9GENT